MNVPRNLVLLILGLCACKPDPAATAQETPSPEAAEADGSLPDRDPALAHRLIEEEGGVLLDVRTEKEFEKGHIDGATNISHDALTERLAEVEKATGGDKTKPIVVYCGSGHRAGIAKGVLEDAGYTRVTNVGGMDDW